MKLLLTSAWPVGQYLIPAGTLIEGDAPQWNGIPLRRPWPITAIALDQEGYAAIAADNPDQHHLLCRRPEAEPEAN